MCDYVQVVLGIVLFEVSHLATLLEAIRKSQMNVDETNCVTQGTDSNVENIQNVEPSNIW